MADLVPAPYYSASSLAFSSYAGRASVLADARVARLGRTMSFGRVTLSSATDNKPVAMVSSAFAML
jgi:acyl-coenzyme A thioesterase PaaI-like protein